MKQIVRIIVLGAFFMLLATPKSNAGDIDRTKRPVGKAAPKVTLPEIQKATLANGLKIWLVERHQLPTVAMNLVVNAGSDHDPIDQTGIASMTADVMDEGTATRDALQISDAMESLGAMFNVSSSWDGSFVTLNVLTKYLTDALAVYTDVLVNPVFPEKEFERLRKQRLTSLMQQRDQPVAIANNAYSHILYGSMHPYGNNPSGTESSLESMTTADLKKFYQAYYRPNNATLVVVGDVTMGDLKPMLEASLAGWKFADVPTVAIPEPPTADKMRVYLVDKPGAPQSEIRIGYPALARSTPDYFPVTVMNRMLGGQFTSRINLNLREKHGFTYGARSVFNFQKGIGPFTASAAVQTEKTDSSVREFMNEINLMRAKGMTADELSFVKKGSIGSFALSFETSAQIAGTLQNIILYSLPEDYYQNYLQNIEAVSLVDVNRVARKYLDTSKMAVVVVGDLAKIKDGIAALGLGDVALCDVDGKLIQ